jgi:hypothetical protein
MTTLATLGQRIREAQATYQGAIDAHERENTTHMTHSLALLCDHEVFSMGCYGDFKGDCDFQTVITCINDTYEAQVNP